MKVIDQLKTHKDGYQTREHDPTRYFTFKQDLILDEIPPYANEVYRTEALLSMRQVADGIASIQEKRILEQQAAEVIARELYGDIVDRLYDILKILYENGPLYNCKVTKEVKDLIDELSLRN